MKNSVPLPPDDQPLFTWRDCEYCDTNFLGRSAACMICRTAIKYGQAIVLRSEEEDSPNLIRTIITHEEVLQMRQTLETETTEKKKRGPQRKPLSAPDLETADPGLMLRVNSTMQAESIRKTLDAATSFFDILGEGEYRVDLKISRIEGDGHGANT